VSIVVDLGLRVTCNAAIRWPVLGIDVPIDVPSITMTLGLSMGPEGEHVLAFRPQVEAIDVSWIPEVFDRRIVEKINQELQEKHLEIAWRFAQTLSHRFALPGFLRPIAALDLGVVSGKVRIRDEAMVMAVTFKTHVVRDNASPIRPIAAGPSIEKPATRRQALRGRTGIGTVAATALAGVGAYLAFGAMTWAWRHLRRS